MNFENEYKIDYKELYTECNEQIKYNQANSLRKTANMPFKANKEFLPDLLLAFSSIKLQRVNGKISSTATIAEIIKNHQELGWAIKFINLLTRSELYVGSAKDNARYCALVPLFMSAHKEYNNIKYEEWDKTDPKLYVFLGEGLYKDIMDYTHYRPEVDDNIKVLRNKALNYVNGKGEVTYKAPDAWPNHSVPVNSNLKWKATDLVRHIKLQTWMAHVSHRNEYMILDTINWDNIPDPFDAEISKVADPLKDEYVLAF